MKTISKYLIIFVAVIGFASVLPKLYKTTFSQPANSMLVRYSAIIHDFVHMSTNNKGERVYGDFANNSYSQKEFMKLLPFMYYSNLEMWGEVPETVNGEFIDRMLIMAATEYVRVKPADIDTLVNSRIKLYPLFESAGDISELSLPNEYFRMNDRMEFITTLTNTTDEAKTTLFTDALKNEGFAFPAKIVSGNETTMKPFDFGYFMVDAKGELYHVFQASGAPKVYKVDAQIDGNIKYMVVKEQNRPHYGMLVTDTGAVYRISTNGYKLDKLYVENYHPDTDNLLYYSDLQNVSIFITGVDNNSVYVSNIELETVDKQIYVNEKNISGVNKMIFDTVFPFTISSNAYTANKLPVLNVSESIGYSFVFSVALAFGYVAYRRKKAAVGEVVSILLFGIYSFIVVMLLNLGIKKR